MIGGVVITLIIVILIGLTTSSVVTGPAISIKDNLGDPQNIPKEQQQEHTDMSDYADLEEDTNKHREDQNEKEGAGKEQTPKEKVKEDDEQPQHDESTPETQKVGEEEVERDQQQEKEEEKSKEEPTKEPTNEDNSESDYDYGNVPIQN